MARTEVPHIQSGGEAARQKHYYQLGAPDLRALGALRQYSAPEILLILQPRTIGSTMLLVDGDEV